MLCDALGIDLIDDASLIDPKRPAILLQEIPGQTDQLHASVFFPHRFKPLTSEFVVSKLSATSIQSEARIVTD